MPYSGELLQFNDVEAASCEAEVLVGDSLGDQQTAPEAGRPVVPVARVECDMTETTTRKQPLYLTNQAGTFRLEINEYNWLTATVFSKRKIHFF